MDEEELDRRVEELLPACLDRERQLVAMAELAREYAWHRVASVRAGRDAGEVMEEIRRSPLPAMRRIVGRQQDALAKCVVAGTGLLVLAAVAKLVSDSWAR